MMLKRTMDATFLNSVANHPDVRPMLGGKGPLDLASLLSNPENIGLQNDSGGFVITKLEHGVYECHSMFLPEGRGAHARGAMDDGLQYLFTRTDCLEVVTKAPDDNKPAFGAARSMGFSVSFRVEKGWETAGGDRVGMACMRLPLVKWVQHAAACEEGGQWFHRRLEELTAAHGKAIPVHYEEESHNRAAGAAVLMFQAGNPVKAAATYNLWAKLAGFPVLRLLSLNPVVIDMDQVVVGMTDNDMEILLCR